MTKGRMLNLVVIAALIVPLVLVSGCAAVGGAEGESNFPTLLIFMALIFGIFYFISIRPQRKRQKQHQQLIDEIKRGDRVVTAGGIHGQVESISEESIVIKVESGATLRMVKNSVALKEEK